MPPQIITPAETLSSIDNGTFEEILSILVGEVRKTAGRDESPSLGIIDSRSGKTSHHVDADRGIDGNKKIKGRKEHIVTDPWDFLWR